MSSKKIFDIEDSVNDFLYFYNNSQNSTTKMSHIDVMRNIDNKEVLENVIMMTDKSKKE